MTNRLMPASSIRAAAVLAVLVLPALTPAGAAMPGQTVSVAVITHDLDLTRTADRARLQQRLRLAAMEACGEASFADPRGRRLVRACRADAVRAGEQAALAQAAARDRLAAR